MFYKAGECFPLFGPLACLIQLDAVIELIEPNDCPQYLQVYFDFSLPSYSLCFPLFGPSGCLMQLDAVKLETLENFCPQYSQ